MISNTKLMQQLHNVGVPRSLPEAEIGHVLCLLRLIENLPIVSDGVETLSEDELKRKLASIHENHIELAKGASLVMKYVKQKHEDQNKQLNSVQ